MIFMALFLVAALVFLLYMESGKHEKSREINELIRNSRKFNPRDYERMPMYITAGWVPPREKNRKRRKRHV